MHIHFSGSGSDSEIEIKRKKHKKPSEAEEDAKKSKPEEQDIFGEELADLSDDDEPQEEPEREVRLLPFVFVIS